MSHYTTLSLSEGIGALFLLAGAAAISLPILLGM